jgi:hypothetical protein
VATAMQESALDNIPGGTQDAVDLFQQRPSQGWGTPAQLMDPHDAATRFYRKLLTVPGWQVLPLTDAAQAVQQSAYPEAYAQWQPEASTLVTAIASTNGLPADGNLGPCVATCLQALESSNNQTSPGPGCLDGLAVLGRAATWLTAWNGAPVPYLSSADPSTWFDRYRRDCSGYASMALGLPGPGLDTAALAAASTPIPKNALRAGDLLVNPAPGAAGHVVIFDRWTDSSMTSYIGYEQSGDRGTHHRVIPYPYFSNYPMSPYRYGN